MNIKCPKCGRDHSLPDNSSDNKRIYFFCSDCRHKIVIDGRKKFITGTTGTLAYKEETSLPVISDILDNLPRFFNFSSFLMSMVFAVSSLIISLLTGILIFKNISFFSEHIVLLTITAGSALSIILFGYNLLLYFISKVQFYSIDHQNNDAVDWKFILFDFPEDAAVLLIVSVGVMLGTTLLLVPSILFKSWGILYAGVLFPLIFTAFFFLSLIILLQRFIPAVIASRSLYVNQTLYQMFRFLLREIINIPFYYLLINIISWFIFTVIGSLFFGALALASAGIAVCAGPSSIEHFKTFVFSLPLLFTSGSSAFFDAVPFQTSSGILLILFFVFILFLLLWSVLLNIKQALVTQACWIMQNNPVTSIPKPVILLSLCAIFILLLISSFAGISSVISSISGFIK